jgi:hypothetical protein
MEKKLLLLALFILSGFSKANCQTPDWVWAKSATNETTGWGEGFSATTDGSGNVFVAGWYHDTIAFGSYIFNNANGAFLAKYDSASNLLWAKCGASIGTHQGIGTSVVTDSYGNSYLTGWFVGSIVFDYDTLKSIGAVDFFVVKFTSSGNIVWAKNSGGPGNEAALGITTDNAANVYLTGYFSTSFSFASDSLINSGTGSNLFIVKYDSSGNALWGRSPIKGYGGAQGFSVATDDSGHIYLTGIFGATSCPLTFGADTLVCLGSYNMFLVKYDSIGNVRWAKNIGGAGAERGYCVAVDNSNRIYITGGFDSTAVTFDTITIQRPAVYNDPMYIAGYDSAGHVLFAKALGSGGDDNSAVAVSPSGCIYIGGDFWQVNPFIIGNDSLFGFGEETVFTAKLWYPQIEENIPETITNNQEFIFYPNPFDDKLNVASPPAPLPEQIGTGQRRGEEEELTLFDVFGRVLLRRSFVNSATINTEQLEGGIYFYEVSGKDGVGARGKIVKN